MKKWLLWILILLVVMIVSVFLFIPSTLRISAFTSVGANQVAAVRLLLEERNWKKWWPASQSGNGNSLFFKGTEFSILEKRFQGFKLAAKNDDYQYVSEIVFLPLKRDSFEIEWKSSRYTGLNPFARLSAYRDGRKMEQRFSELLAAFKSYMENSANVYGAKIAETKVTDSIILVGAMTTDRYPSAKEIYALIEKLKDHAAKNEARETNFPMLNTDSIKGDYFTRVGLPIDREVVVDNTNFTVRRMVLGFILVADVTGGPHTIQQAIRNMELYMSDAGRRSPAIPYESLIVDRFTEPDTSKWKTRIYYPVY